MNRDQLNYFALVYQEGSVAAAAARVPMSTQGMGKAIHALEHELGVPLFRVEANGGRTPTPYAQAFMAYVHDERVAFDRLQGIFDEIRAREAHEIRLAAAIGINGFVGAACVDAFQKAHPGVTVRLREVDDFTCDELLRNGTADIGFTLAPFGKGLATMDAKCERAFWWVPASHPLAQRAEIGAADLDGCILSSFGDEAKIHHDLVRALDAAGARPARIMQSSEVFWHYRDAFASGALGLTVEHLAASPVFAARENVVAVPSADLAWRIGISWAPAHVLSDDETAFCDFARAFTARH